MRDAWAEASPNPCNAAVAVATCYRERGTYAAARARWAPAQRQNIVANCVTVDHAGPRWIPPPPLRRGRRRHVLNRRPSAARWRSSRATAALHRLGVRLSVQPGRRKVCLIGGLLTLVARETDAVRSGESSPVHPPHMFATSRALSPSLPPELPAPMTNGMGRTLLRRWGPTTAVRPPPGPATSAGRQGEARIYAVHVQLGVARLWPRAAAARRGCGVVVWCSSGLRREACAVRRPILNALPTRSGRCPRG